MCIHNNETYIEQKLIVLYAVTDTIYSDFLHQ